MTRNVKTKVTGCHETVFSGGVREFVCCGSNGLAAHGSPTFGWMGIPDVIDLKVEKNTAA
jgi:hypothetical protein